MAVRVLLENDLAAWWQIRLEALENEPFAFGMAAEEHRLTTVESTTRLLREAHPGSFYMGAFADGILVGIATFIRDKGLKHRHKGHIFGVYVTAAHRGKGVGRAMIAAVIERATEDPSLEQILIDVTTCQDAASKLYRDLGFEVYGTEPNALRIGSLYADEDHMILRTRQRKWDSDERL